MGLPKCNGIHYEFYRKERKKLCAYDQVCFICQYVKHFRLLSVSGSRTSDGISSSEVREGVSTETGLWQASNHVSPGPLCFRVVAVCHDVAARIAARAALSIVLSKSLGALFTENIMIKIV